MSLIRKNKTDYLYFIHIPRTAGRYINSLFKQNDYELRYDDFTKIDRMTNREIPHLHKPHYRRYNVNRAPIFCIVRNPIDRFISAISPHTGSNFYEFNPEEIFKSQKHLNNYLDNLNNTLTSNWFLPQHCFIDKDTHIWKYEDQFKFNFLNWLKDKFNITLTIKENAKSHITYRDLHKRYPLDKKYYPFIKEYYRKDYELFYPRLIDSLPVLSNST